MSPPRERRHRRRTPERLSTLGVLVFVWLAGFVVIAFVKVQSEAPADVLLVDPSLTYWIPWYAGLVTNLGAIAWTTATVAAFIGARTAGLVGRHGAATMFRGGALFFSLLTLDDVFGFHAWVLPDALGTTKVVPLAVEAALGLGWVVTNRRELRRTRVELLIAAAAAFAVSVGVDLLVGGADTGDRVVIEDGAKFLGVLALAAWSTRTTLDVLASLARRAQAPAAMPSERDERQPALNP